MYEYFLILTLGFFMDLLIGDPAYRLHPMRLTGRGIHRLEGWLRRCGLEGRAGGILLVLVMEMGVVALYISLSMGFQAVHPVAGRLFDLYICYSCLALKDLFHHIRPVVEGLTQGDLNRAQTAVSRVVGRDAAALDRKGVIRAVIETMAENFIDGFLTPLFWFLAGGLFGHMTGFNPVRTGLALMLFAKAASTLDSMVGYKDPEYICFGWAGARLDDVIHFIPARLSLFILFPGAWFSGLAPANGFRIALRDRRKHDSPNAAHAESFVSGALGIRLGGPATYHGAVKKKPWLGGEYADPSPEHIMLAERLIMVSAWVSMLLAGLLIGLMVFI